MAENANAIVVTPAGMQAVRVPAEALDTNGAVRLDWLQQQVGGYVEIALTNGPGGSERVVVVCDEEGWLKAGAEPTCRRCTDGQWLAGRLLVLRSEPGPDGDDIYPLQPADFELVSLDQGTLVLAPMT